MSDIEEVTKALLGFQVGDRVVVKGLAPKHDHNNLEGKWGTIESLESQESKEWGVYHWVVMDEPARGPIARGRRQNIAAMFLAHEWEIECTPPKK